MNWKKKNEKEKTQKATGAAQELDMDALENVAGGRVVKRDEKDRFWGEWIVRSTSYDVVDEETGKVVKTFHDPLNARSYDSGYHRR